MSVCDIVVSNIFHMRHGGEHHPASHVLRRRGLSIWIDLDRLEVADRQSFLFSVDRFNLLGFHQRDHGPNFKSKGPLKPLGSYVRQIADELMPEQFVDSTRLLTFPRILGAGFSPVSVYVAKNKAGTDILYIYEVRNTFGDMHSYIGKPTHNNATLEADKVFHVSPFFPIDGVYRLGLKVDKGSINLAMRYFIAEQPALTATLRGTRQKLDNKNLIFSLLSTMQLPFRPILSIHLEALKLWLKKVPFYKRPDPPVNWSSAKNYDEAD